MTDWGEIKIAPEVGGVRMKEGTGTLWRVRRVGGRQGRRPPEAREIPLYALLFYALPLVLLLGLGFLVRLVLRR